MEGDSPGSGPGPRVEVGISAGFSPYPGISLVIRGGARQARIALASLAVIALSNCAQPQGAPSGQGGGWGDLAGGPTGIPEVGS